MTTINDPNSPLSSIRWAEFTAPSVINVYYVPGGLPFNDGAYMTTITWTPLQLEQAELAFRNYENVANLNFNVVATPAQADFFMVSTTDPAVDGVFGYWGVGGGSFSLNGVTYGLDGVGVFNGSWSDATLSLGGVGYVTLLHEIGHGMGLAHPHDNGGGSTIMRGVTSEFDTRGDFDLNQGVYTTLTYNDGWQTAPHGAASAQDHGFQGTLMALDIAVLQQVYGANATHNNGNNTYALPGANQAGTHYAAIWDTGGTDQIVYDGSLSAVIDLTAATLDYSATGGGVVSYAQGIHGGFTIANGVTIENASGGGGADTLTGNSLANVLNGGGGTDTVVINGAASQFAFTRSAEGNSVLVSSVGGSGAQDTLISIETIAFTQGGTFAIDDLIGGGVPTPDWFALPNDVGLVASTYQFFTDAIPEAGGFEYLISSNENSTDLNDLYYSQFNLENRYINFASNLGTAGVGQAIFQIEYAFLPFERTIREAYNEIIGIELAEAQGIDTEAAISFLIGQQSFYAAVAAERVVRDGVSLDDAIQIVAIGSVMHEAIKAGVGRYADEVEALVADLTPDGQSSLLGQDMFSIA